MKSVAYHNIPASLLLNVFIPQVMMRLHNELLALVPQLATLEERCVEVIEELKNV